MDYVVAGFGIGAILALIGFALWELFGNVEEAGSSWQSRAAIGLMLGALVIWAVTGVSLISHIDDATGSRLVLLTTLVTLVSIGAGTYWYWRVDRAEAATRPRPRKIPPAVESMAVAGAPAAMRDYELTEWDSWPERTVGKPNDLDTEAPTQAPAAEFEAEIAAEPLPVAGAPESALPSAGTDTEVVVVESPTNILQFPSPAPSPVTDLAPAEDVVIAETVDIDVDEVVIASEESPEIESVADTLAVEDAVLEGTDEPGAGADEESKSQDASGFESALLVDIDESLSEDDGAYRSPLLADLGLDQLEGVGLAKWRTDARLTDDDVSEAPAQAKQSR